MHLSTRLWAIIITVSEYFSLSPLTSQDVSQIPIGGHTHHPAELPISLTSPPRFLPPGSNKEHFKCDYRAMGSDWVSCVEEKGCWLKNKKTGQRYDTKTDYESDSPTGITRNITLVVTDGHTINVDGIVFKEAKLINGTFPGPLLEACWGDTLNINVINKSKFNGTSIHWHGIRQNQTMHMDGVNGITQCPIAPGDSFNYSWKVDQYGSSWYHSHTSVQYADGVQAPITLHGPTTELYDEPVDPLIVTDWLHNSAFEAIYTQNTSWPTILLDGKGNCTRFFNSSDAWFKDNCIPKDIPQGYVLNVTHVDSIVAPGHKKRYLLRIINTSFTTSITFSIDNHNLTIVEADFVPVEPHTVNHLLVAIGQRYHVIVEAEPTGPQIPEHRKDWNFWIRTNSSNCSDDNVGDIFGYERTGIFHYDGASHDEPTTYAWPGNYDQSCIDNVSPFLKPAYKWTVTAPKNGPVYGNLKHSGERLQVSQYNNSADRPYNLGHFAINPVGIKKYTPFQTSYGNPTFLNLDNFNNVDPEQPNWPANWLVIEEDHGPDDFVYLILQGSGHPIHLHGHDFAIVEYDPYHAFTPDVLKPPYHNPMRRDVVLLPGNEELPGYAVIAFKTDNPGAWLMHCHIALHASWGLSLQIMERQSTANQIWAPGKSPALTRARQTCAKWNTWAGDCTNLWPGAVYSATGNVTTYPACVRDDKVQPDSGI